MADQDTTAKLTPVGKSQQTKAKQYKPEAVIKKVTRLWDESRSFAFRSLNKYVECGHYLLDAKDHMDPDAFTAMLRNEAFPFDEPKAWRLMRIAGNPLIIANLQSMPDAWTTVAEIARLDDDVVQKMLDDGSLNPETTAKEMRAKIARKAGRGLGSFGRNTHSPVRGIGSKADEKAALILKAACLLNDYQKQHNRGADEDALEKAFDGLQKFLKADVLNGLEWAIELHDLLEPRH